MGYNTGEYACKKCGNYSVALFRKCTEASAMILDENGDIEHEDPISGYWRCHEHWYECLHCGEEHCESDLIGPDPTEV